VAWVGGAVCGLVMAAGLAACGADEDGYCAALAEEEPALAALAGRAGEPGVDLLTPTLTAYQRLRDEAPDELGDEWDTVVLAHEALADEAAALDVQPDQLRFDRRPQGVTAAEFRQLRALADELASTRVRDALQGIEDHASQVCDVDFAG
jgi:hypothetical protein